MIKPATMESEDFLKQHPELQGMSFGVVTSELKNETDSNGFPTGRTIQGAPELTVINFATKVNPDGTVGTILNTDGP